MKLWIVGKNLECFCTSSWEYIGVYDSEEKAIKACIKDEYFIGPVVLNETLPDETVAWVGAYYPNNQNGIAIPGENHPSS